MFVNFSVTNSHRSFSNQLLPCRERDIDEVLQATTVFSNVSKGTLAKHEDLVDVFGTDDEEKVCRIILSEGDLQVISDSQIEALCSAQEQHQQCYASAKHALLRLAVIMARSTAASTASE